MTCLADEAYDLLFSVGTDVAGGYGSYVFAYSILGTGIVIALLGSRLLPVAVVGVAFVVGFMACTHVVTELSLQWECTTKSVVAATAGAVLAAVSLATVTFAIFVAGASVAGASAALAMSALPEVAWSGAPSVLGYSLVPFWAVTSVAALLGGCAASRRRDSVAIALTAMLGAWAVAFATKAAMRLEGQVLPDWAFLATVFGVASAGAAVQQALRKKSNESAQRV